MAKALLDSHMVIEFFGKKLKIKISIKVIPHISQKATFYRAEKNVLQL